jgi:hypothetical protein
MKVKSNWKRTMTATAVGTAILGVNLLWAGEGNKFEFDKTVYNAAEKGTTEIKATPEPGYKFSGESRKVKGHSTIKGTTVTLKTSASEKDTQMEGKFVPDGTVSGEAEIWILSQEITVINHYIKSFRYQIRTTTTVFWMAIVAKPTTLGLPILHLTPAGGDRREVTVDSGIGGKYLAEEHCVGIYQGGTLKSEFFGNTHETSVVPRRQ